MAKKNSPDRTQEEEEALLTLAEGFGASCERVTDEGYWPTITFTPPQLEALIEAATKGELRHA